MNSTGLCSPPSSHAPVTVSLGAVGGGEYSYHSQPDSPSDECGQRWEQEENKAQRHQWERPCQGEQGKAPWKKMDLSKRLGGVGDGRAGGDEVSVGCSYSKKVPIGVLEDPSSVHRPDT